MNINDLEQVITPDIYNRFREAIAIGKWPDGKRLTPQQKEICLQAIIVYEHKHISDEEKTGYVPPKSEPCESKSNEAEEATIKWQS